MAWVKDGATVFELNEAGHNLWSMSVQEGFDENGERISQAECEKVAQLAAAAPYLRDALIEAKRDIWVMARGRYNLADFKNFAVVQQIDAALQKADGMQRVSE